MEKSAIKEALRESGANDSKKKDSISLAKHMSEQAELEFQQKVAEKKQANAMERQEKYKDEQRRQLEKKAKNVSIMRTAALVGSASMASGISEHQPMQLNRNAAGPSTPSHAQKVPGHTKNAQSASLKNLPKFKAGNDIAPIIAIIRQRIKN